MSKDKKEVKLKISNTLYEVLADKAAQKWKELDEFITDCLKECIQQKKKPKPVVVSTKKLL